MAERRERRAGRSGGGSNEPRRAPRRRRKPLTPEERAYRDARRIANLKLAFYTHLVAYGSVLALILVATRSFRVMLIVATAWGIGVAIHYFVALVAPGLRQRMIDDEVGRRVQTDVQRERRAIEKSQLRSMEDLSASIAHEIRNPITAAKSLVQQMGEDPISGGNIEYAKVALTELDRVERSISHLLRFAREESLRREVFSMEDLLDSALATFRDRIARQGVTLREEIDRPGPLAGDSEKLRRVVINLIANALDALEESGRADQELEVVAGENLAGTEVWLRIRDNGTGMENEMQERIFSPFYTTKDEGTGLGLALSKKAIEAHGGTIELHSPRPMAGTEFVAERSRKRRRRG